AQQTYAAIARIGHAQRRVERNFPFEAQVPLLCVGHLQVRINNRNRMAQGLWPRREDKTIGRVGDIRAVADSQRESVRRIKAHRRSALREDRLEKTPVIDTVSAAYRSGAAPTGEFRQPAVLPAGAVSETDARLSVVLVRSETVIDAILDLARGLHIFVSHTQVQRQVRFHLPIVFSVKVRLADAIFEEERPVAFLESPDTTRQKR